MPRKWVVLVAALLVTALSATTWALGATGGTGTSSKSSNPQARLKADPPDAAFLPGDIRPDAPELAARGPYGVGVRTLHVTNPNQVDILRYSATNTDPRYDRPLTLEVWYPADVKGKKKEELATYSDVLGSGPNDPARPNVPFEFQGRALRDAKPDDSGAPYPLIIVSHGYPGSRVLLTNLTENLASKGYVVVAIDHTESTHGDKAAFSSTLLNRPLDILFVLDQMAELGEPKSHSFLSKVVDANRTALVGYSMGGYGVLTAAGAGITAATVGWGAPGGKLAVLQAGTPEYEALLDKRIKAIVAFAPCCATFGIWDADGLKGLKVPSLFVVGDQDQTAPFAGVKYLFGNTVNADRYMLVYQNGDHEVPVNPAPQITYSRWREYVHYQEPAWDNTRTNNVNQHFLTAFLGIHLNGKSYDDYLDLKYVYSNESNDYGKPPSEIWKGFKIWSAVGMEMHHLEP